MSKDINRAATAKEQEAPAEATAEGSNAAAQVKEATVEAADETVPTVRQIFSLPEKESDPSDDRWQSFQEKVSEEIKGIKWTSTIPDLAPKVCELLDIKIPNLLITAWKKVKDIQAALEKSKESPDETVYLELAQHTINSEHKPSIEVKIKGATVKKIELAIQLGFNLKGFLLKIQNGGIKEIETGRCEAKGTIKYGGLTIAEKKLEPIKLPFSIPIPSELFIPIPNPPDTKEEQPEDQGPAEDLERIEL
jgi:hypothetical protein